MKNILFSFILLSFLCSCSQEVTVTEPDIEVSQINVEPNFTIPRETLVENLIQEKVQEYKTQNSDLILTEEYFEFAPFSTLETVIFLEESSFLDESINYGRLFYRWDKNHQDTYSTDMQFLTLVYDWDSLELLGFLPDESSFSPFS